MSGAAVRAAFGVVPPAIVGPSVRNVCSPAMAVPVPLGGTPAARKVGKLKLQTRAKLFTGRIDKDTLQLVCLP